MLRVCACVSNINECVCICSQCMGAKKEIVYFNFIIIVVWVLWHNHTHTYVQKPPEGYTLLAFPNISLSQCLFCFFYEVFLLRFTSSFLHASVKAISLQKLKALCHPEVKTIRQIGNIAYTERKWLIESVLK